MYFLFYPMHLNIRKYSDCAEESHRHCLFRGRKKKMKTLA